MASFFGKKQYTLLQPYFVDPMEMSSYLVDVRQHINIKMPFDLICNYHMVGWSGEIFAKSNMICNER